MTMPATQPVWADAAHTRIDLVVDHPQFGSIPFTAAADDVEAHGRDLHARAVAGEFGPIGAYEPPAPAVPAAISRRQCAAEMFARGLITGPEAVAMTATATPPALVEAMLAALPETEQTFARIDFGAGTYARGNPLLNALMTGTGADQAEIDGFFIAGASR